MCNGFGCLVVKNAEGEGFTLKFSEPDADGDCSHSEILARLGWPDNQDQFNRQFVRVEYPYWTEDSFHFDEYGSLPTWVEEGRDSIEKRANRLLKRVRPIYNRYKRARDDAHFEYRKERDGNRKAFDTAYTALHEEFATRMEPINDAYHLARNNAYEKLKGLREGGATADEVAVARAVYIAEIETADTDYRALYDPISEEREKRINELSNIREKADDASVAKWENASREARKAMVEAMSVVSGYAPDKL